MTFASCSEKYNIMPILYQIIFVILTEFDGIWSSCGGSGFELCKNGWGFIFLFALKVKFLSILSINGVSPENAKWKIWAFMFFLFSKRILRFAEQRRITVWLHFAAESTSRYIN